MQELLIYYFMPHKGCRDTKSERSRAYKKKLRPHRGCRDFKWGVVPGLQKNSSPIGAAGTLNRNGPGLTKKKNSGPIGAAGTLNRERSRAYKKTNLFFVITGGQLSQTFFSF